MHEKIKTTQNTFDGYKNLYGQYFIENSLIIKTIIDKTDIKRTDVVLEIGSGTGNLTMNLLKKAKRVISIEFDLKMVLELQRRVQRTSNVHNLTLIHGDILKINLPTFDVCVANISYQLSASITLKLLTHRPSFRSAVIMYQSEFSMRLTAKPGEPSYGRLSINTQLVSSVKYLLKVGINNFRPRPKVESSVIRIEPKNPIPMIDFLEWDGLIRLCFGRKNKTLGAIFRQRVTLLHLEQNYFFNQENQIRTYRKLVSSFHIRKKIEKKSALTKKTKISPEFKEIVSSILTDNGFIEMRSVKMRKEDFLHFMVEMNSKGIYFT